MSETQLACSLVNNFPVLLYVRELAESQNESISSQKLIRKLKAERKAHHSELSVQEEKFKEHTTIITELKL